MKTDKMQENKKPEDIWEMIAYMLDRGHCMEAAVEVATYLFPQNQKEGGKKNEKDN